MDKLVEFVFYSWVVIALVIVWAIPIVAAAYIFKWVLGL